MTTGHKHVFYYKDEPEEGGRLVCDCGVFKWQWSEEIIKRFAEFINEYGWHIEFYDHGGDLVCSGCGRKRWGKKHDEGCVVGEAKALV